MGTTMTPSPPQISPGQLLTKQEERLSDFGSEDSGGCIDNIVDFDPDAVDFEPLLVTGTGKILTYHRASYYEDEHSLSVTSSTKTPIASNASKSFRSLKYLLLLVLAVFTVGAALSWFAIDSNNNYAGRLQTTVAKDRGENSILWASNALLQHMMNADVAAFQAAESQVSFWEPYLDHSGTSAYVLVEISMGVMSQCFGRSIFAFHVDDSGAYQLQALQLDANNPSVTMLQALFTPNVQQAVTKGHQGAFIAIFHDPIHLYLELHAEQNAGVAWESIDNVLVRDLAGIGDGSREITDADYQVAKEVLRSKFVIGSCDNPEQTLRRLEKMMSNAGGGSVASEPCAKVRQNWNQECRRMKEMEEQNKNDRKNGPVLRSIKTKHRYDILLYGESKKLFREQNIMFE